MWGVHHSFFMSTYPNRLREWRERRGLSQQQVADMAGCSKVQISTLERGRPSLDLLWMQRLAPILHVTPGDLLNPADNPAACRDDVEWRMICAFRNIAPDMRLQFVVMAEVMANGVGPSPS